MMGNSILTINAVRVSDVRDFICHVNVDGNIGEGRTQLLAFIDVKNRLTINSKGLYSVHSELYLTVVKEDMDAFFHCEVTYSVPGAEKMIESEHINITIHYPTSEVIVFQDSPQQLVKEGDSVELRCQGDGNPQPVKTFMHNNEVLQTDEDRLVLHNVTRLNSGLYECSCLDTINFENIIGSLNLTVHYLDPVVIIPENTKSLDEGQDLSLTCNALSSLATHAFWYKDHALLEKGNVLILHNASFITAGTYLCEVVSAELPELKRTNTVHIRVRGKPMITDGVAVIPLDTEKAINVSCRATGHPTPTIHWSLSDKQAQLGRWDTRTENSVLSIISISTSSAITASCRAFNDLGTTETSRQIQASEFLLVGSNEPNNNSRNNSSNNQNNHSNNHNKQYDCYDGTKEKASSDDIVVEMKSSKSEEAVLLQGVNGDKRASRDQEQEQDQNQDCASRVNDVHLQEDSPEAKIKRERKMGFALD
ncbi:Cell surface glycoprotein MUC18 [Bagarius yarrelli]|uniref:Cell surface glycoprotein MUC18 n=1 Tax=Bagarius yarrelli TaxID=175774 RepID=A0A556V051_BAGYA|nr:Cell surface glycoprotein MUC18 [Bagarius yarrelli]